MDTTAVTLNLSPLMARGLAARALQRGTDITGILLPIIQDQVHDECLRQDITEETIALAEARATAAEQEREDARTAEAARIAAAETETTINPTPEVTQA